MCTRKCTYIVLVDGHDEVAMYHQQTNQSQQTIDQTIVVQEIVSPEVSKLKHVEVSKKQGDQMQFCP